MDEACLRRKEGPNATEEGPDDECSTRRWGLYRAIAILGGQRQLVRKWRRLCCGLWLWSHVAVYNRRGPGRLHRPSFADKRLELDRRFTARTQYSTSTRPTVDALRAYQDSCASRARPTGPPRSPSPSYSPRPSRSSHGTVSFALAPSDVRARDFEQQGGAVASVYVSARIGLSQAESEPWLDCSSAGTPVAPGHAHARVRVASRAARPA